MDATWLELVKQLPSTAAVIVTVAYFLKHMRDMTSDFHTRMEALVKDGHEAQHTNSTALHKNTEALGKVTYLIDRVNGRPN